MTSYDGIGREYCLESGEEAIWIEVRKPEAVKRWNVISNEVSKGYEHPR